MLRLLVLLSLLSGQFGQSNTGELRLTVTDPDNLPLASTVTLVSESNQIAQRLDTDASGTLVAKRLPFGKYKLEVSHAGFASYVALLDIRSALPLEHHAVLSVAPIQAQVSVTPDQTLIDPHQTGTVNRVGMEMLKYRATTLPGRSTPSLVNTQPGWLLEANGVLHPRGSEYQVQFVVDGMPVTDNRSPSFAPEIDADEVRAMNIFTGGYPAEYGRKLGGVVEIVTAELAQQGVHGGFAISGGSFAAAGGSANLEYTQHRTTIGVNVSLARTNRYLDPPAEENFTNHGDGGTVTIRAERDFSDATRLGAIVRHGQTRFQVPNERAQEDAGQLQQRTTAEMSAQASYQHVFGGAVADVRGMVRTLTAGLSSNSLSTPIAAQQDRGLDEGYVKATVSSRLGPHELKAGGDLDFGTLRESFGYHITNRRQFDGGTPLNFAFDDRAIDREQAVFVQDRLALGPWTITAGLRWDHYRLLVDDNAFSPRIGVAWTWPSADLVIRTSYDRAFQTPAIENLLLASSPAADVLNDDVIRLPVPPSIGDFYEVGFSKRLFGRLRLDATYYDREMTNFADDDVLLNTGVSFPIAFQRARIRGTEVKLELPRWRALTGSISYTNMFGVGTLPITGGLFLGDEAAADLGSGERFPISQDQRNTVSGRVSYRLSSKAWIATAVAYGSGLPVEFAGSQAQAVAQYGQRIVDRVDFERGRVRPSLSLDLSGSIVAVQTKSRQLRVQADLLNLTDRLNVINFAGLFSGTALAPPRSFMIRVQASF
ncbi:MAG TPA: TonB-dependent receptor [Vicinamibacterales bacterium]|nr:TonB-dependent receptor [Vicinamibacterales bacterium]